MIGGLAQSALGDCREVLRSLPTNFYHTIVTSPPYFRLRSYLPENSPLKANEIGQEETPEQYVANLVAVFREARRTLRDDGTLWLNLGDSYVGPDIPDDCKEKDLIGIPWMVAFALRADGWHLRC